MLVEKKFYSVIEVAHYFGVSKSTIWNWSRDGLIGQPVKIGPKSTRWTKEQILRFEANVN